MRIREHWPVARSKQRRREFAAVFDGVAPGSLGDMLEVGSGDGFMASLLAPLGRSLITTEPTRGGASHATHLPRIRCSATALPFDNASFDFIFSSSVLEHIADRSAALAELGRVLRPQGTMVHLMPSVTWKMLQLAFYYPHLLVSGLEAIGPSHQLEAPKPETDHWHDAKKLTWFQEFRRGVFPQVHGEFKGHVRELIGFRARTWSRAFETAGFTVQRQVRLPLYSGYGFGLERLRRIGEKVGMSAHNAFFVTKASA
jgi:SAM-dependent methyltransferase